MGLEFIIGVIFSLGYLTGYQSAEDSSPPSFIQEEAPVTEETIEVIDALYQAPSEGMDLASDDCPSV